MCDRQQPYLEMAKKSFPKLEILQANIIHSVSFLCFADTFCGTELTIKLWKIHIFIKKRKYFGINVFYLNLKLFVQNGACQQAEPTIKT